MFFKKDDDKSKLPDLPPLPRATGSTGMMPYRSDVSSSLPSFPDSPSESEMHAPRSDEMLPMPKMEEMPRRGMNPIRPVHHEKAKLVEMEEWEPESPKLEERQERQPEPEETEEPEPRIAHPPERKMVNVPAPGPADVFVRIDKFHSARKALEEIEGRLADIDELVKKIRETKLREEQELAAWEKDLMHIKSRVQGVAENIFEKVE